MEFDYASAKPINILNTNNKLQCNAFIDINYPPPGGKVIRDEDFEKIYVIKDEHETIFVKLVDFSRVKFENMSSLLTIVATGQEAFEWAMDWLKKYPKTQNDTVLAVYCYKRLK